MDHAAELAALVLLLAVGHGVISVTTEPLRLIARSFLMWTVGLAVVIALFSIPGIVTGVVRFGMVLVGAYAARWLIGDVASFLRGPHLMAEPDALAVAEAARRVSDLPSAECRDMARRIVRDFDGTIALLGLAYRARDAAAQEKEFAAGWREGCEKAVSAVREVAERFSRSRAEGRPPTMNIRFIAQAFCAYEPASVARVLERLPAPALSGRARRARAAHRFEKEARRSPILQQLGLERPAERGAGKSAEGARPWMLLAPWAGFARYGYSRRAAALGVSLALLLGYGLVALALDRASGWVYLAVAGLIHIEAAFALGDFLPAGPPAPRSSGQGGRT